MADYIDIVRGPKRAPIANRERGNEETAMASADIVELTDANFETEVLSSDVPALVDF